MLPRFLPIAKDVQQEFDLSPWANLLVDYCIKNESENRQCEYVLQMKVSLIECVDLFRFSGEIMLILPVPVLIGPVTEPWKWVSVCILSLEPSGDVIRLLSYSKSILGRNRLMAATNSETRPRRSRKERSSLAFVSL